MVKQQQEQYHFDLLLWTIKSPYLPKGSRPPLLPPLLREVSRVDA